MPIRIAFLKKMKDKISEKAEKTEPFFIIVGENVY